MKLSERILHVLIFQITAGAFGLLLAVFITGKNLMTTTSGLIAGALIAMLWNGIFNYVFDKVFGEDRLSRGLKIRLLHITLFEIGIVILITPVYALFLRIGIWEAFLLNLAMIIYFTVYALIFNWVYDIISHRIKLKYNLV